MSDEALEIEVRDIRLIRLRKMHPKNQYPEEDHDLSNLQQSQIPQTFLLLELLSDKEQLTCKQVTQALCKGPGNLSRDLHQNKKIFH